MGNLETAGINLVRGWWKDSDYRKMSREECLFIDALNNCG
jgi:hypothetical protein